MLLILDKTDLISLVKGTIPNYSIMSNPIIDKNGRYSGSYDRWEWNYKAFEECTESELLETYYLLKSSHN